MTVRTTLPARRTGFVERIEFGPHMLSATVNVDPRDGIPRECFLSGYRGGTELQAILDDASVIISLALQHGITARQMSKSVARLPAHAEPSEIDRIRSDQPRPAASAIGLALDLIAKIEGEMMEREP